MTGPMMKPGSFVERGIRMSTLDEWNQGYQSEETAEVTKLFSLDTVAVYSIVRKIEQNLMTQVCKEPILSMRLKD